MFEHVQKFYLVHKGMQTKNFIFTYFVVFFSSVTYSKKNHKFRKCLLHCQASCLIRFKYLFHAIDVCGSSQIKTEFILISGSHEPNSGSFHNTFLPRSNDICFTRFLNLLFELFVWINIDTFASLSD